MVGERRYRRFSYSAQTLDETHPLRIAPTATGQDVALSAPSATIERTVSALSPKNEQTERLRNQARSRIAQHDRHFH
jgi:hypothetical protein